MKDFLIDESGDLRIENGDFVIGTSDGQNQNILLVCEKGDFKENPQVGVGLGQYLESDTGDDLIAEIRRQFVADGLTIDKLSITSKQFELNAHY